MKWHWWDDVIEGATLVLGVLAVIAAVWLLQSWGIMLLCGALHLDVFPQVPAFSWHQSMLLSVAAIAIESVIAK